MRPLPKSLRWNLWVTDLGFLMYWTVTAAGCVPGSWLFKDYDNPIIAAWNWSFAPLDLLASTIGLLAVFSAARQWPVGRSLALVSASLTFCAGFMAMAFWTMRCDFSLWWWLPNVYLAGWPLHQFKTLIDRRPPLSGDPPQQYCSDRGG
jgi:hypothetical protein